MWRWAWIDAMNALTELNELNLMVMANAGRSIRASPATLQRSCNGEFFAYIGEQFGEQFGGCTGSEMFQEVLESKFEYCENFDIPSFPVGLFK